MNDNALGKLPLKIIVPITDWKDKYETAPWMVKLEPNKRKRVEKSFCDGQFSIRSVGQFPGQ